jgi:lipoic acid synthetase
MILGDRCTRNCAFCAVVKGAPCAPDKNEPENVASAVKELRLRHAVITSVTRDDLPDGGAAHFAAVIWAIKKEFPVDAPVIEVLIPDFQGSDAALMTVIEAAPDIINHNVETIPRLYPAVRPKADYARSLNLLKRVKDAAPHIFTKSGIMLGLGETGEEILQVFQDLRAAGCDMLTVGQYLAPSRAHYPVQEYVAPKQFDYYKREAQALGFLSVASAPLVRSSYMAKETFEKIALAKQI